ncbi:hypothetical protein Cantr_01168 [Candida viswanathii]|uniref:Uncharacterized protein n=1 Tax=Candida viswanathii TaxID=5486 RepID=A0A367YIA4_9ASCO|nr:hypothetical protein Cantr_01168 [Candida viswanathii]
MSKSPTPATLDIPLPKTSLIISNLNKQDFVQDDTSPNLLESSRKLALADQIKLKILNYTDDIIEKITHWSNLPFLNRIIVIFRDEPTAQKVCNYITTEFEKNPDLAYIKIHLQENLLTKSKSSDNMMEDDHLNVSKSLNNFKNLYSDAGDGSKSDLKDYNEPKPAK